MGQSAIGILYGCKAPKGMDLWGEDGPTPDFKGVLGRWEEKHPPKGYTTMRIRAETEGGAVLLGVWVAVGGSGEDGAPRIDEKCIALDDIASAYKGQIAKAKNLWDRFATHVLQRENVELPAPVLWLTPCEVA